MTIQIGADPDNFSEKFAVIYNQYKRSQIIMITIWALALPVYIFGDISQENSLVWIFVLSTIAWNFYYYFKLACPRCNRPAEFTPWSGGSRIHHICPNCQAVLVNESMGYSEEKKALAIIVIVIALIFIAVAIVKGVTINPQ